MCSCRRAGRSCTEKCRCKVCDNAKARCNVVKERRKRDKKLSMTGCQSTSSSSYAEKSGYDTRIGLSKHQSFLLEACVYVFGEVNGSSILEIGEEMVTRKVYEIYKSIRSQSEWRDEEWFKRTLDITLKDLQTWVKKLFKQVELLKKLKPIS